MKNFILLKSAVFFCLCLFSTAQANINLSTDMAFVNREFNCGLVKIGEGKGDVKLYEEGQLAVSGSVEWAHTSVSVSEEYYEFKLAKQASGSYSVTQNPETGLYKLSKIGFFTVRSVCEEMSFTDLNDFPY